MKAIIPAAGFGTRFLPATKSQPKEMLPVVDKPVIQYVVEEAAASGITDILIITGRGKRSIEDHFDKSFELEHILENRGRKELLEKMRSINELANIHYIRQKDQLGLGHAILCAKKFVMDEPFLVLLGDTIIKSKELYLKKIMDIHRKYSSSVIGLERVPKELISRYGIVEGEKIENNTYLIKGLVEKPKPEEAKSNLAIMGRYLLTPRIFDFLEKTKPSVGGEIQLTDALEMLKKEENMYGYEADCKRYDIGSVLDWIIANIELGLEREEISSQLKKYLDSRGKKQ